MTQVEDLKAEAHRLGFALTGVTSLEPLPHIDIFQNWIDRSQNGEMDYLSRPASLNFRTNPANFLPWAKSILSFALPYPNPNIENLLPVEANLQVAAYAWRQDYHAVIRGKLRELSDHLPGLLNRKQIRWAGFSDAAPIMERDLAQRAGLGWIGKNTCLISPTLGSFFLLAEIAVDFDLPFDQPFMADRCGKCRRCIDACPTQCIRPDRTLDASRCISYQTIENRGIIPPELRSSIGGWIFGCDICQSVCPWNKKALPVQLNFVANSFQINLQKAISLCLHTQLSDLEFSAQFQNTPFHRLGRSGFYRNICVALGNSRFQQYIPELSLLLNSDPDPLVRQHAAWALARFSNPQIELILSKACLRESNTSVLSEINQGLSELQ